MAYLNQERARLQSESEAAAADQSVLTAALAGQQQGMSDAEAQVSGAQAQLAQKQADVLPAQAAADVADRRVMDIDRQIDAHAQNEPDRTIEVDGRPPRPNPAWITWNQQMQRLSTQRAQGQASAQAAHARLQTAQLAVSQAQEAVQAALLRATNARAAVAGTQAAIAAVEARRQVLQDQMLAVASVNMEIDRDPINRRVLEQTAAELSARAGELEQAHTEARLGQEDAEEALRNLLARRDDLTQRIADATTRLPDALARLTAARQEVADAEADVTAVFQEGPLDQ